MMQLIRLEIDPAERDEIGAIFAEAAPLFATQDGLIRAELLQSPHEPQRMMILLACVDWEALRRVNQSQAMQAARAQLARRLTAPFSIEQYEVDVLVSPKPSRTRVARKSAAKGAAVGV